MEPNPKLAMTVAKALSKSRPRLTAKEEADLLELANWLAEGSPTADEDIDWANAETQTDIEVPTDYAITQPHLG